MGRIRQFLTKLAANHLPDVRKAFESQRSHIFAAQALDRKMQLEASYRQDYIERATELIEAKQMAGTGPWLVSESRGQLDKPGRFKESNPITSTGAFGDISLALENVEWRREVNLSWLEFSRWGIQQIILISRLYYIKNPMIQRGVNVAADYVFARGCEVSSDDTAANDTLTEFFHRNASVLGPMALVSLEKQLYYDGQIFFTFFPDKVDSGLTSVRTIDATEILDVITNPDDSSEPRFYRRLWTQRVIDQNSGSVSSTTQEAWYPALNYEPDERPDMIGGLKVMWESPVLHMRGNVGIAKWHFDLPRVYAALDWAKTARKWLEWCATVKQALSQVAMTLTTKGGQQALEGIKQQLGTSVGAGSSWDTNPAAAAGSIFASGPGTTLAPFMTKGAGGDPSEVKEYRNMVGQVLGIPPTWLGDLETANLATATTLDRPTETGFIGKQENWRGMFLVMAPYVLRVSKGAASGKLRESLDRRKLKDITIMEAPRKRLPSGRMVYTESKSDNTKILIRAIFPEIREGDMPELVKAWAIAMTLENKGGQIIGIDAKAGIRGLMQVLDIDNPDEILDKMFPEGEYDPDRTKEPLPPPAPKSVLPPPGGDPQLPAGQGPPTKTQEAIQRLIEAARNLLEARNLRP